MAAERSKQMLNSVQLTLGELILKLESVKQTLPVVFDDKKYKPTGLGSWRGSYKELSIQYEDGGSECYEQPKADCKMDETPFGRDHAYNCPCGGTKAHSTSLPKNPKVKDLLAVLKIAQGNYFVGYKGGDFTMGKTTPVWVANYGTSSGFKENKEGEYKSQAVVDVEENKTNVVIKTQLIDY